MRLGCPKNKNTNRAVLGSLLQTAVCVCSREGILAYSQVSLSFHRIFTVLKIGENLSSSDAYDYAILLRSENVLQSGAVMIHQQVTWRREG